MFTCLQRFTLERVSCHCSAFSHLKAWFAHKAVFKVWIQPSHNQLFSLNTEYLNLALLAVFLRAMTPEWIHCEFPLCLFWAGSCVGRPVSSPTGLTVIAWSVRCVFCGVFCLASALWRRCAMSSRVSGSHDSLRWSSSRMSRDVRSDLCWLGRLVLFLDVGWKWVWWRSAHSVLLHVYVSVHVRRGSWKGHHGIFFKAFAKI